MRRAHMPPSCAWSAQLSGARRRRRAVVTSLMHPAAAGPSTRAAARHPPACMTHLSTHPPARRPCPGIRSGTRRGSCHSTPAAGRARARRGCWACKAGTSAPTRPRRRRVARTGAATQRVAGGGDVARSTRCTSPRSICWADKGDPWTCGTAARMPPASRQTAQLAQRRARRAPPPRRRDPPGAAARVRRWRARGSTTGTTLCRG